MSNKIFVDTLFVVALINQRDQYHQQASELADRLQNYPLLTTDAVLLEIGNALARNYKNEAVEIIEEFLLQMKWKLCGSPPNYLSKPLRFTKLTKIKHGVWSIVFHSWS